MSLESQTASTHRPGAAGTIDPCACGVCGTEAPPLIGSILTGVGLTLDAAATQLEDGTMPAGLTNVQQRLVEAHAEARIARG